MGINHIILLHQFLKNFMGAIYIIFLNEIKGKSWFLLSAFMAFEGGCFIHL